MVAVPKPIDSLLAELAKESVFTRAIADRFLDPDNPVEIPADGLTVLDLAWLLEIEGCTGLAAPFLAACRTCGKRMGSAGKEPGAPQDGGPHLLAFPGHRRQSCAPKMATVISKATEYVPGGPTKPGGFACRESSAREWLSVRRPPCRPGKRLLRIAGSAFAGGWRRRRGLWRGIPPKARREAAPGAG
jgi:hypothetical protein